MKILFIIGILVLARSGVNSHHCYVCKLENCSNPFPVDLNHRHIDCNKVEVRHKGYTQTHPYSTGCMKKIVELNGKQLIERDCYFGSYHQTNGCMDFYNHTEIGEMISCEICSHDLCNQSTEINVTSIGVVMAALIACYYIF